MFSKKVFGTLAAFIVLVVIIWRKRIENPRLLVARYVQQDERWAELSINGSEYNFEQAGGLIISLANIFTKMGFSCLGSCDPISLNHKINTPQLTEQILRDDKIIQLPFGVCATLLRLKGCEMYLAQDKSIPILIGGMATWGILTRMDSKIITILDSEGLTTQTHCENYHKFHLYEISDCSFKQ